MRLALPRFMMLGCVLAAVPLSRADKIGAAFQAPAGEKAGIRWTPTLSYPGNTGPLLDSATIFAATESTEGGGERISSDRQIRQAPLPNPAKPTEPTQSPNLAPEASERPSSPLPAETGDDLKVTPIFNEQRKRYDPPMEQEGTGDSEHFSGRADPINNNGGEERKHDQHDSKSTAPSEDGGGKDQSDLESEASREDEESLISLDIAINHKLLNQIADGAEGEAEAAIFLDGTEQGEVKEYASGNDAAVEKVGLTEENTSGVTQIAKNTASDKEGIEMDAGEAFSPETNETKAAGGDRDTEARGREEGGMYDKEDPRTTEQEDSDMEFDKFADRIVQASLFRAALSKIETECGPIIVDARLEMAEAEGGEEGGVWFWGDDRGVAVDILVQRPAIEHKRGVTVAGCEPCSGGGGIAPDAFREIREYFLSQFGEANALFLGAGVLTFAERVGQLEVEALNKSLEDEYNRLDAGTGLVSRALTLAAKLADAEHHLQDIQRRKNSDISLFQSKTGLSFAETWADVPSDEVDWLLNQSALGDLGFGAIFAQVATQAKDTEEGADLMHKLATTLVQNQKAVLFGESLTSFFEKALRRVQKMTDEGKLGKGDESEAVALFLGAQRKELVAVSELVQTMAKSSPPLRFRILGEPGTVEESAQDLQFSKPTQKAAPASWVMMAVITVVLLSGLAMAASLVGKKSDPD
jgi:hypothetical protein